MEHTPDFTLEVQGVRASCPTGDAYATQQIAAGTIPVPHSTMASWVRGAERVVMIDGCFLKCHHRVLNKLVAEEKIISIEALPMYKKYEDKFLMDDVPAEERNAVARQVADQIIAGLRSHGLAL